QHISSFVRLFDEDRGRHIFNNQVQKLPVLITFLFGVSPFSDVFMRRYPTAAWRRLISDGDDPPIRKLHHFGFHLSFLEDLSYLPIWISFESAICGNELCHILIWITFEGSSSFAETQKISERGAELHRFWR